MLCTVPPGSTRQRGVLYKCTLLLLLLLLLLKTVFSVSLPSYTVNFKSLSERLVTLQRYQFWGRKLAVIQICVLQCRCLAGESFYSLLVGDFEEVANNNIIWRITTEWSSPNSGFRFSYLVPKQSLGVAVWKSRMATVCAIYYLGQELLKEVPPTIRLCQRLWFG